MRNQRNPMVASWRTKSEYANIRRLNVRHARAWINVFVQGFRFFFSVKITLLLLVENHHSWLKAARPAPSVLELR
jgi:hypothetical protein